MIASIQKATRILTVVADNGAVPTPLCKIAERTELAKPTCSHIVSTLVQEGFLIKISPSKGYVIGPAAYCLSRFGRYKSDLIAVCRPIMQYLYNTLGHCVVLAVIEGSTKYVIDYIDDGTIFEQKQKIRKDDIYRTATGRAILKNMTEDEISDIWQKYGKPSSREWAEIQSLDDLLEYRSKDGNSVISTQTPFGKDFVSLGYAMAIMRGVRCVGALGIAVKLSTSEKKSFVAQEEKKIKNLLSKGASLISEKII